MFPLGKEYEFFFFTQTKLSLNLATVFFLTASFLAVSGEPFCAALCGVCPSEFSRIYPRLPRGPVRVQRAQM